MYIFLFKLFFGNKNNPTAVIIEPEQLIKDHLATLVGPYGLILFLLHPPHTNFTITPTTFDSNINLRQVNSHLLKPFYII